VNGSSIGFSVLRIFVIDRNTILTVYISNTTFYGIASYNILLRLLIRSYTVDIDILTTIILPNNFKSPLRNEDFIYSLHK